MVSREKASKASTPFWLRWALTFASRSENSAAGNTGVFTAIVLLPPAPETRVPGHRARVERDSGGLESLQVHVVRPPRHPEVQREHGELLRPDLLKLRENRLALGAIGFLDELIEQRIGLR